MGDENQLHDSIFTTKMSVVQWIQTESALNSNLKQKNWIESLNDPSSINWLTTKACAI